MQAKEDNPFGTYLRSKLELVGMSIRKLAHECGYDPATISRLVNGKQKPRPDHLVRLAQVFQVPLIELWQAAGYVKDERTQEEPCDRPIASNQPSHAIKETVSQQSGMDLDFYSLPSMDGNVTSRIIAELEKYRLYAQTDEGQEMILQNFVKKIDQLKGVGPFIDKLQIMYSLYLDEKIELEQKHTIGSVLLYFILPTDIIPDYLFPMGYFDDAMAIDLVWQQIQGLLVR